jgi:hypothetical protein
MAEERSFLNEGYVYVSNTRIILNGTTYATANVTSVRKHVVPANRGCALVVALFSGMGSLGTLPMALSGSGDGFWGPLILCLILLVVGILWFRAMTPTYHLMLATAGGERSGLWSKDESYIDRVAAAITDAIVHRG